MKKKVKVEFEFCFDHSKGNLYEACGVNEEAVKEFLSKGILQYIKETNIEDEEATKLSGVVEWTVKNAPSDYLMFLLSKDLRNVYIEEIIEKQKN